VTASRIGSVGYLNAAPLTRGIEERVHFDTPAALARLLRAGQLDAALVSITEVLLNDAYDVLDGFGIISRGEVKSVLLAHRVPLTEVREVFCHTASLTSVNLLKVLLAGRGLRPAFRPLDRLEEAPQREAVLLIGDPALDFLFRPGQHQIWDLGAAWWDLTGLPFVYAAWALRRGAHTPQLRAALRQAGERGRSELDALCRERPEYDLSFRRSYLGGNIRYELGPEEKRGLLHFVGRLREHGLGPVTEPRFVE
jgi:predicted solute-binding protein